MSKKPKRTTLLERIVGTVSPTWLASRERARHLAAAHRRAQMVYEGASVGRRSQGWRVVSTDANDVSLGARSRLRDVAREMVRNNPTGNRLVSAIANNVVGRGIIPSAVGPDDVVIKQLEDLLVRHCDTPAIDAVGRQDLYGLQHLTMRTVVESGEALVRYRPRLARDRLPLPFQLQVMEPDYIDTTINGPQKDGTTVIQGVAFGPFGKIEGYWLFPEHPGSSLSISRRSSSFVPASVVSHVFLTLRPGQVRGVSWFAPVVLKMKDLADFEEAHLVRQKIAACFAAFIRSNDDDDPIPELGEEQREDDYPVEQFEPGMIEHLRGSEEVQFGQPPQVGDFDGYVKSVLSEIASGVGVSYEALSGDYSKVNFSSARMGWLEFQRSIDCWRDYMLIPQMLFPLGNWFLEAAQVELNKNLRQYGIKWTSPRREMIDPAREVPAIKQAIRAGLSSRPEEQRKLGFEPEVLDQEIADSNARADKLKLVLDSDPRKVSDAGLTQARPDGTKIPSPDVGDGEDDDGGGRHR